MESIIKARTRWNFGNYYWHAYSVFIIDQLNICTCVYKIAEYDDWLMEVFITDTLNWFTGSLYPNMLPYYSVYRHNVININFAVIRISSQNNPRIDKLQVMCVCVCLWVCIHCTYTCMCVYYWVTIHINTCTFESTISPILNTTTSSLAIPLIAHAGSCYLPSIPCHTDMQEQTEPPAGILEWLHQKGSAWVKWHAW